MARKEILVEELVEVIYQWHMGSGISKIKRSLGLDRKTIQINLGSLTYRPERKLDRNGSLRLTPKGYALFKKG